MMNNKVYKEWVQQIQLLSSAQLNDVLNRIKILNSASSNNVPGKKEFGDRLLQSICVVLIKKNVECPSVTFLRRSSAYATFNKNKSSDLATFFSKVSNSRLVQDMLLKEAVSLLYDDLQHWQGIAISSHTLIQQAHRLPAVLNRAFPGYASNGLLHKIVRTNGSTSCK